MHAFVSSPPTCILQYCWSQRSEFNMVKKFRVHRTQVISHDSPLPRRLLLAESSCIIECFVLVFEERCCWATNRNTGSLLWVRHSTVWSCLSKRPLSRSQTVSKFTRNKSSRLQYNYCTAGLVRDLNTHKPAQQEPAIWKCVLNNLFIMTKIRNHALWGVYLSLVNTFQKHKKSSQDDLSSGMRCLFCYVDYEFTIPPSFLNH